MIRRLGYSNTFSSSLEKYNVVSIICSDSAVELFITGYQMASLLVSCPPKKVLQDGQRCFSSSLAPYFSQGIIKHRYLLYFSLIEISNENVAETDILTNILEVVLSPKKGCLDPYGFLKRCRARSGYL